MNSLKDFFLVKALAIVTASLFALVDSKLFLIVSMGASIAHFMQGAYYGRNLLKDAASRARGLAGLLALTFVWLFLSTQVDFGWGFILFLPHYAFTEAYFGRPFDSFSRPRLLLATQVVFEGLVYFLISRRTLRVLPEATFWLTVLAIVTLAYLVTVIYYRARLPIKFYANIIGSFFLSVIFLSLNYFVFRLPDDHAGMMAVFVHGLIWFYYPLYKSEFTMTREALRPMAQILVLSVVTASVFYWLFTRVGITVHQLFAFFIFCLYFHLLSSLASSRENPNLIVRFFHGARPAPLSPRI